MINILILSTILTGQMTHENNPKQDLHQSMQQDSYKSASKSRSKSKKHKRPKKYKTTDLSCLSRDGRRCDNPNSTNLEKIREWLVTLKTPSEDLIELEKELAKNVNNQHELKKKIDTNEKAIQSYDKSIISLEKESLEWKDKIFPNEETLQILDEQLKIKSYDLLKVAHGQLSTLWSTATATDDIYKFIWSDTGIREHASGDEDYPDGTFFSHKDSQNYEEESKFLKKQISIYKEFKDLEKLTWIQQEKLENVFKKICKTNTKITDLMKEIDELTKALNEFELKEEEIMKKFISKL